MCFERVSRAQDPSCNASIANVKLAKTGCQIISCDMLLYRSPLTGHALLLKVHNMKIYGIYVLISWKHVARPDCQAGCLQTEMRPLMQECFDLLSLKSSRRPLPAMEREHYHSIPLLYFPLHALPHPPSLPLSFFCSSVFLLFSFYFLFATAHPLKHVSFCAIHQKKRAFYDCKNQ